MTRNVRGRDVGGFVDEAKRVVLEPSRCRHVITAKVYDGDFKVLHDVQAVPASGAKASEKSEKQAPSKK